MAVRPARFESERVLKGNLDGYVAPQPADARASGGGVVFVRQNEQVPIEMIIRIQHIGAPS